MNWLLFLDLVIAANLFGCLLAGLYLIWDSGRQAAQLKRDRDAFIEQHDREWREFLAIIRKPTELDQRSKGFRS